MPNHIEILEDLHIANTTLLNVQCKLDLARLANRHNNELQLHLDREQTKLNEVRKSIKELMTSIPASN